MRAEFKPWTKEEIKILLLYYKTEGLAIKERLPDRTIAAIKSKVKRIYLYFRHGMKYWSQEELNIITEFYPAEGNKVAQRLPWRSKRAINIVASRLGVKRVFNYSKYYKKQKNIV